MTSNDHDAETTAPHTPAAPSRTPADEARGAAGISLGQASLMVMGGVLALLITQFFGKGVSTDAFFTAYGFYVIALTFAQTLRLTVLPRLLSDVTGAQEARLLLATATLAALAAIPMVALAGPIGDLIANGDPSGLAAETLRLLWPALALHLLAGMLVAMLVMRGIYAPIGVAFAITSLITIAAFVLLEPELDLRAVAVGLALSAVFLASALMTHLWRAGWRPAFRQQLVPRQIVRDCGDLFVASSSFLMLNLGYLICLAVANRASAGTATTYAYAFFGAAFLVASTAVPSAMVRAPRLLDAGGNRGVTVADVLVDYRVALVLLAPAIGLVALVGAPLIDLITGSFFGADDSTDFVTVLVCLTPWVLAATVGVMLILESLNRGRGNALAAIAVGQAVVLLILAKLGDEIAGIAGIAIAQSTAMFLATAAQIRLAMRADAGRLLRTLGTETLRSAALVLVSFGPGWLAISALDDSLAVELPIAAAGLAIFAIGASRVYPAEWKLLVGVLPFTSRHATT
ncbi:MAG: lipid II flippase MurJ [Solirubrobacterales bacterium]